MFNIWRPDEQLLAAEHHSAIRPSLVSSSWVCFSATIRYSPSCLQIYELKPENVSDHSFAAASLLQD